MTPENLWGRIEPLLAQVERPTRYLDHEWASTHKPEAAYRVALAYPDVYEVGQANQAIGILYRILNSIEGVVAERAFLPWIDLSEHMRAQSIPAFSLESCAPLASFDLLGITLPYELTYTNILELLDLAGIPLRASDRGENHPIVVGGGPCVYNPEPIAAFFDAILIGEGEEAVVEIAEMHRSCKAEGLTRTETVERLAEVAGVYVPSHYHERRTLEGAFDGVQADAGFRSTVYKRVIGDFAHLPVPGEAIVPFMDVVHDRVNVEVLRGCTRGCRFCQAGMVYRPVRERSADEIVRAALAGLACTGHEEVSLTSLSTADHSMLDDVLRRLSKRLSGSGMSVSLPSLRVDAFSVDMARMLGGGRKSGLTFAPEAGTQRMRDVINKNVTEEDLLGTLRAAFGAGWRRVKLYFMIGLPTETDEDIVGIGALVSRVLEAAREVTPKGSRGAIRIGVSVSTFVPKVGTPFQWEPQIELPEVMRRQSVLREHMPKKGVELSWHDADVSFLEGVMARGGREIADVIEAAWRRGARFDAWTERFSLPLWREAFADAGVVPESVANRARELEEPLPWEHISSGVSRRYLLREAERSTRAATTPDCSFGGCTGCDVCGDLGVSVVVEAGVRA